MNKDKLIRITIIVLGFLSPVILMNYLQHFNDSLLLIISLLLGALVAIFLWGLLFGPFRGTSRKTSSPGTGGNTWLTWASVFIAAIVIILEGGFYYLVSPETTADPSLPLSACVFIFMVCSFLFCWEGGWKHDSLFFNRRIIGIFTLAAVLTIISAFLSILIEDYGQAGSFFFAISQISLAIMAGAMLVGVANRIRERLSRKGILVRKGA